MKRELVESYFDWNEIRLEAYLRIDPELIELEGECEKTMDELEPYAIFDSGADAEQFFYRLGLRDGIRLHKIVKSIIKEIS